MERVVSGGRLFKRRLWVSVWLAAMAVGGSTLPVSQPAAQAIKAESPPRILDFLPQGQVSGVEAVQIRFSGPVTSFGDAKAQPPVVLNCEGRAPAGQGRWLDDARWTYLFEETLPAGVACSAQVNPDFRNLNDQPLSDTQRYEFDTGAPQVTEVRPYRGSTIDEEQVFILRFNAEVDAEAVAANSHCVIHGLAEQVPMRAVSDEHREALMEAAYMPQADQLSRVALLQCARALPPEAAVRVEVGPGVRALGQAEHLKGSSPAEVLNYEVRSPFTAKMSCTRERAGQPCLPITPLAVSFSAPVPRDQLKGLRLAAGGTVFEPEPPSDDLDVITYISFPGPFPPEGTLTLSLPAGLQDEAGRTLENAARFPLSIKMADLPPLAKFASGTFGVIERFAHAIPGSGEQQTAAVPVTLRHIESSARVRGASWSAGKISSLRSVEDADVLAWYTRLRRLEHGRWSRNQVQDILAGRSPRADNVAWSSRLDARAVSVLSGHEAARRLSLPNPPPESLRPLEVVGIPLEEPGFHVLEIESPRLGESLLEGGPPMYVRTGVLLTNMAVHLKHGRDDLLVWVTSLSDARPVADADITVRDCSGRVLARGRSDADGVWHHLAAMNGDKYCRETGTSGLFVSARIGADHPQAYGSADYSFVMSDWDRGIESWRFNVPTSSGVTPELVAHTVFDRSLFRAGETVSMKHFLREETRDGLALPRHARPDRLLIEHEGSDERHELPLTWEPTRSGGLAAVNTFTLPESAKLGSYSVRMTNKQRGWYGSGQFRVEEFRLPLLAGQIAVRAGDRPGVLVAPERLAVDMQLSWISGGAAMGQAVELTAVAEDRGVYLAGYDEYSFTPPPSEQDDVHQYDEFDGQSASRRTLFVDGRRFQLDENGTATVEIEDVPHTAQPQRFVFEAGFADPNGEIQTLSQTVDVWPSEVQAGIRTESWDRAGKDISVGMIALGTDARPRAGVPMRLLAVERKIHSVRKRMVGGFYRYDSHVQRSEPETLCTGVSNAAGLVSCSARFDKAGAYELQAVAEDGQGRESRAYRSIWISGAGEQWFGGAEDDRIDLIPAQREWAVGEDAEFQVRMPFREAVALVSVEREGVLWSQQVKLQGKDPRISVPVSASWGPNAYVSVLVLRGRLYELPWQSFFEWGWRKPASWLQAWNNNKDDQLVTSQIDLAKPAFRFGLAELRVSGAADSLKVEIQPESDVLQVREEAVAKVKVSLPDGSPAAHGTVTLAVVDEALLELSPNESWKLYEAMHPRRSLAVKTATSQLEVVGRRHYGRKAVAAGGGGGNLPTRQLFDTLLSWQPTVELDENGEAEVRFKMNDALSRFRIVALADHGAGFFGGATSTVTARQDLQLVSGLPPAVREGDRYLAETTLRNGTEQERSIEVKAGFTVFGVQKALPAQTVKLAPGTAGRVSWEIEVPDLVWPEDSATIAWRFEAGDGSIADRVAVTQQLLARLPVTTVQASLLGLVAGETTELPVAAPADAQRSANGLAYGGIAMDVASSLVGSQEGVHDWWRAYPYVCLEQTASQALALNDAQRWSRVVGRLLTHMDSDGLLRYFPGNGPGSEVLTAYLVSVADDARRLGLEHTLPPHALDRMLNGLQNFVEGRIRRNVRLTDVSLDSRRLMAMEALARHGRVSSSMLSSLYQSPEQWPTHTVVDWLSILAGMPEHRNRDAEMAQARSILVSRMTVSGGAMMFSDVSLNASPGLMATRVSSLARLVMVVADQPGWKDDVPLMVQGLLAQQVGGRWQITTENLLGVLALQAYAQHFEPVPAIGVLHAGLGGADLRLMLPPQGSTLAENLDWPQKEGVLQLSHHGEGRAWVGVRAQARVLSAEAHGAGYRLERRMVPVQRRVTDTWSRGDVYRVEIDIHSRDAATWVVLNDPIPAGATILGSGLGRDAGATLDGPVTAGSYHPAYVERTASAWRAYFDYLPAGKVQIAYTVRLNATGSFSLPPTRVEALYRPDLYGSFPNSEGITVGKGYFDEAGTP